MPRILIVAGDPSGDLYGSLLIRALRRARRSTRIEAVGGPLMKATLAAGDIFHSDLASLGVTGFIAPIKRLPTFVLLHRELRARMEQGAIDAVVCIDFYGFNRHILSAAKRCGVPALYFISPQVWATRAGRIRHIKSCVDRMLVIFPFEEELYRKAGVPVTWVGHPLLDVLPPPNHRSPSRTLRLGILPGSRSTEVQRHLPVLLRAAERIRRDFPHMQIRVFAVPQLNDSHYTRWLNRRRTAETLRPVLVREADYAERSRQDFLLTSSGTATLENALLGIPMVVIYKVAWPTYLIARSLIRVRHIAMANILAERELVPELVQHQATPEKIARKALDILGNPRRLQELRRDLSALRTKLRGPGAIDRTAEIILNAVGTRRAAA
ncbi:MAG: lipid-A-disaccharide synthase [Elusimicrobiota bacterium]